MRKFTALLVIALMSAGTLFAANPFSDVPFSHWAYDAVSKLAGRGYVQGFPDGTFKGNKPVTRYALAMVISKLVSNLGAMGGNDGFVTRSDLSTLEKLTVEFADELALLGVKVTALEDDMQVVKDDLAAVKGDVAGLKDFVSRGGSNPVRWSGGDFGIRYHNFNTDSKNTTAMADSKAHEVDAEIRFHVDISIDEDAEGHATVKVGDIDTAGPFGNGIGPDRSFSNMGEWSFQEIYINHKNLFGIDGNFVLGRKYVALGNKMALATEIDGVIYSRRFDQVDIDLFWSNARADARHQVAGINLEHDFNSRHHGYLYFFTDGIHDAAATKNASNIDDDTYLGLGLNGSFNDHWDYYLAYLGTTEDKAGAGFTSDLNGNEFLVGVKYFPNKEWDFRLQYAAGDDELVDGLTNPMVNTDHRYYDDSVGPYEDVARAFMGMGTTPAEAGQIRPINTAAFAVEANWHYNENFDFRLAYDAWETDDNAVKFRATPFTSYNATLTDYDFGLITFESRYKISANGRFRFGISALDFNAKTTTAGAAGSAGDFDQTNMYGEFSYKF